MANKYDFKEQEPKILKFWQDNNIFKFNPHTKKEIYAVDTPPPTMSGAMHIGHASSYSQQDMIVRYKKMRGYEIFFPFGTDDNGLPTERLVEKTKKVKAIKMPRKEFVELCEQTRQELRTEFIKDWQIIGMACDFDLEYATINKSTQKLSQSRLLDLYNKKGLYRHEAPMIWCPHCQTAIAQVELEDKEKASQFNDIIFKAEDGEDLIIATTRPELLPSCVAIFVHPEDERHKNIVGKKAKVPLFEKTVEVLTDARVAIDKGTGIVMCCTFGDQTDIEWYKAYNLPLIMSITGDGKMTKEAGKYEGLSITEARKEIIADLKENNLLVGQKDIKHAVNVHERCGTPIEIMNSKQWFIKYLDKKEEFHKATDDMNWYPDYMKHRLHNWIDGLQWDWCISNQRFFGIPFPFWYCKECDAIIPAKKEDLPVDPLQDKAPVEVCPKCSSKNIIPDNDIINTWATSSLTPDIALELLKGTPAYEQLKGRPFDLRPQAHDIITFWLFTTMVRSIMDKGRIPFKDCVISGWVLDPKGKKMSKSKGNIIPPHTILEKYGADTMRFWVAGGKLGDDRPFQEQQLQIGKKTVNKLWNAANFVGMMLEDFDHKTIPTLTTLDKWVLTRYNKVIISATNAMEQYNYAKARQEIEQFFWMVFCDDYLEMVKHRFYDETISQQEKDSGRYALYTVMSGITKMFAPMIPFITEAIYQEHFKQYEEPLSVHQTQWPKPNEELIDEQAEQNGDEAAKIISEVRRYKAERRVSLKTPVTALNIVTECDLKELETDIKATTKAKQLTITKGKYKIEKITLGEQEKKQN